MSRLQLKGSGEVIATDGCQVLIQGGFSFPWTETILVPAVTAFGCQELPQDVPVLLGRSRRHLGIRVGPWTFSLAIIRDESYPRIESILPAPSSTSTLCRLAAEDAAFLLRMLPCLPGQGQEPASVTLDLNGCLVVRARGPEQAQTTEVILKRSPVLGPPVRLVSNRRYLGRALQQGFLELQVLGPPKPVVCRGPRRTYAWMPLGGVQPLPPSEDGLRLWSQGQSAHPPIQQ